MKKTFKYVITIIMIMVIQFVLADCIWAQHVDSDEKQIEELPYEFVQLMDVRMEIVNNTAICYVAIYGKSSTNRIAGTITIYDETSDYDVGSWNFNQSGNVFNFSRNVSVQSGHEYTLLLDGVAYATTGSFEGFQKSLTRRN